MQNTKSPQKTESPFFELLADAEEIKIREVRPENREKIEKTIGDWEGNGADDGTRRSFFVHIRTKPAPAPTPSPSADATVANRLYLLRSADLLLEDGDFVLARNIYSYLLKSDIRDPEAMKGLGHCFTRLGENTSAKKCFKALFEISAKEECLVWLGTCYANEGDDGKAVENFSKVLDPQKLGAIDQFDLHRETGNCQTRLGNFDAAWSAYHKALLLQPASDTIHVNLGTLEMQRNHPGVALSYFNKAIELNPRNARAYCGIGLVAAGRDDHDAAGRALLAALDLDSQNLVALFQLVNLANRTGAYQLAKERLEAFLHKDAKNSEVRYALSVLLFKEGDWTRCARELDALIVIAPEHAKARVLREELTNHRPSPT